MDIVLASGAVQASRDPTGELMPPILERVPLIGYCHSVRKAATVGDLQIYSGHPPITPSYHTVNQQKPISKAWKQ
jgi:hypothetical protein